MKAFLFCLLFIFTNVACEVSTHSTEAMDPGFQLIDRGEYDKAITYFEKLQQNDSRPQVQIALASAYAGRAGLKISGFWNFAQTMRSDPVTTESLTQSSLYLRNKASIANIEPLLNDQTRSALDSLFETMSALDIYRTRVQTIPYIKRAQRPDVQKAMQILSQVPEAGGHVYRAVLIGAYIRSELDDGFDVWGEIEAKLNHALSDPLEAISIFCHPLTGKLTSWAGDKFASVASLSRDLQIAYPSQSEMFISFDGPVTSLQEKLPEIEATLIPGPCRE